MKTYAIRRGQNFRRASKTTDGHARFPWGPLNDPALVTFDSIGVAARFLASAELAYARAHGNPIRTTTGMPCTIDWEVVEIREVVTREVVA